MKVQRKKNSKGNLINGRIQCEKNCVNLNIDYIYICVCVCYIVKIERKKREEVTNVTCLKSEKCGKFPRDLPRRVHTGNSFYVDIDHPSFIIGTLTYAS